MPTEEEREQAQEARNEKLMEALNLYVAHCGGDVNNATKAQSALFAEALASWIITSDGE